MKYDSLDCYISPPNFRVKPANLAEKPKIGLVSVLTSNS